MLKNKTLEDRREEFTVKVRKEQRKQRMREFRISLLQTEPIQRLNKTQLTSAIEQLISNARAKPETIPELNLFVEKNQSLIADVIEWFSESMITLSLKHLNQKSALVLMGLAIRAGAKKELLMLHQVVTKVVGTLKSNLSNRDISGTCIWILMLIASDDWEDYKEFLEVTRLCNDLYAHFGNERDLLYLVSYLGDKESVYFPAFPSILKGSLAHFYSDQQQIKTVCFDIVFSFVQHFPSDLNPYLCNIFQVCAQFSNQKQYVNEGTMYYRREAFKCMIRLVQSLKEQAVEVMLESNIVTDIVYRIQMDVYQIHHVCFRVLEAFFREATREQVEALFLKVHNFLDILESQGFDREDPPSKLSALRIFKSCLQKFSFSTSSEQNPFRRLLDPHMDSIVFYSLQNLMYHNSPEISQISAEIHDTYFRDRECDD